MRVYAMSENSYDCSHKAQRQVRRRPHRAMYAKRAIYTVTDACVMRHLHTNSAERDAFTPE